MTGARTGRWAFAAATAAFLAAAASGIGAAQDKPAPPASAPPAPTNLQVLPKEISHDRLIAMMRGFTVALGVKCTHCHVGAQGKMDFASDAKPEKATARLMMQMVRRINEQDFKVTDWSQTKVTCFTCHRGAVKPLTQPAASPAEAPAPSAMKSERG